MFFEVFKYKYFQKSIFFFNLFVRICNISSLPLLRYIALFSNEVSGQAIKRIHYAICVTAASITSLIKIINKNLWSYWTLKQNVIYKYLLCFKSFVSGSFFVRTLGMINFCLVTFLLQKYASKIKFFLVFKVHWSELNLFKMRERLLFG